MAPAPSNSEPSNGHVTHLCLTTKVRAFTPSSTKYRRMALLEQPGVSSDLASLRSHTFLLRVRQQRGRQELELPAQPLEAPQWAPRPSRGPSGSSWQLPAQTLVGTTVAPPPPRLHVSGEPSLGRSEDGFPDTRVCHLLSLVAS